MAVDNGKQGQNHMQEVTKMVDKGTLLRVRGALEFYAHSDWNDTYPGGIDCGEYLDTGDKAKQALTELDALIEKAAYIDTRAGGVNEEVHVWTNAVLLHDAVTLPEHPKTEQACKDNPDLTCEFVSSVLHALDEPGPHEPYEFGATDEKE